MSGRPEGEEIEYMKKRGIWRVVPIGMCLEKTGKGPVIVKWVDTDKWTGGVLMVRSRLVARDFKGKGVETTYSRRYHHWRH